MDKEIAKQFNYMSNRMNEMQIKLDKFAVALYQQNADEITNLTVNNVDLLYELSLVELGIQGE